MAKKHFYIVLFLLLFFATPFLYQMYFGIDVSPLGLLLKLPTFLSFGLIGLWLIQKNTSLKFLRTFQTKNTNWLQTITYSFLLLAILYLLQSLGNVTYARFFPGSSNQSEVFNSLSYIISKPLLAIILVGPFVWLNVLFIESCRSYFHSYLSSLSSSKWLSILSIFLIPLILSSPQVGNAPSQFVGLFITNLTLSLCFTRLKDIKPLVIASIIYQFIDLLSFWVYS